jgi:hypothetical protein
MTDANPSDSGGRQDTCIDLEKKVEALTRGRRPHELMPNVNRRPSKASSLGAFGPRLLCRCSRAMS